MLYKKIHRQYLREFRVGRKFKYFRYGREDVLKVIRPHITRNCYVSVLVRCDCLPISLTLIYMTDKTGSWFKGELINIDDITWLED